MAVGAAGASAGAAVAAAGAAAEGGAKGPEYAVPALDKALDILEVLAGRRDGMSQVEIAAAVDRSPSQIFRVLTTLERRGYLFREKQTGLYALSLRLFDLAHRQEPLRALTAAALGPMRRLADETGQSCNLSVLDVDRVRVVAQAESPGDFGFRVRVGATFSVEETATGAVLRAFGRAAAASASASASAESVAAAASAAAVVPSEDERAGIRNRGFLERADAVQPSITDVVFPILGASNEAVAALTVPYVATSFSSVPAERVREAASRAAAEISSSLGL